MKRIPVLLALASLAGLAGSATAQVVSYTGGALTQNYDSMGATGTTTPAGWFVGAAAGGNGAIARTTLAVGDGSTSLVTNWNVGSAGSSDRALGSQAGGAAGGDLNMEVRLRNDSGQWICGFTVNYDGEQWRVNANATAQHLVLRYSADGVTFTDLGAGFNFTSPVIVGTNALDGNLASNRVARLGGVYTPARSIPPGGLIYLRWFDTNNTGNDHLLAIDNFSFTAASNPPPAIVSQPQSVVATEGDAVSLSVGAVGCPVFYQWYRDGQAVTGATNAALVLSPVHPSDAGTYQVVVNLPGTNQPSSPASLSVYPNRTFPVLSLTNPWRYNQSGSDLGTVWKEPAYDASAWPVGRGVLALEDSSAVTPLTNTVLSLTNAAGQRVLTYYFRATFAVTNPADIAYLTLSNLIDDGCIAYLNGTEIYRLNMANGPVAFTNLALASATEGVWVTTNLLNPSALLVAGQNCLAVEVHQSSTNSTDVVMGLGVKATRWDGGPVVFAQPPQDHRVVLGQSVTLSAGAAGYPPLSYQWLWNGVELPGATNAALTLDAFTPDSAGFYSVSVSNAYGAVLSLPARVEADLPGLYTPAPAFHPTNRYVAVSVFHWFTSTGGQLTGPWRPLEGRANWTGKPDFWKAQLKQMMAANIDVLYVHLIPSSETQRSNLFAALDQLRAEGYDVPKVAPFLDPMITWNGTYVDLATAAGKDEFVGQYIRFFNQYYGASTGAYADDYLARQANKPILDTWHVKWNCANLASLTRADVSNRLATALGGAHPCFTNGFVMVTTALNNPTLSFADEKVPQFEITAYYRAYTYLGVGSVQLKGGYWDQNIRNPGDFLARAGGVPYSNAWAQVNRLTTFRVYLESWNEYDEGTGLYAGAPGSPYIRPGSGNPNTDVWSTTGDPFEYIKTTARGAAAFNDTPWQSARFLWHNFPPRLAPGETRTVTVILRNTGDASWTGRENYEFGQKETDPTVFLAHRCTINDAQDEIPLYGGIFRGRPKAFSFTLRAPSTPGQYTTHWSMRQQAMGWFGEELSVPIQVIGATRLDPPWLQPDGARLRWNATNGIFYTLEYSDTLRSWSAVAGASNLPGPPVPPFELRATNTLGTEPTRFYRVRLNVP